MNESSVATESKASYSRHPDDRFRYGWSSDEKFVLDLSKHLVELLGRFPDDFEINRDLGRGLGGHEDCGSSLRTKLVEEAREISTVPLNMERAWTFWRTLRELPEAFSIACTRQRQAYVNRRDPTEIGVIRTLAKIASIMSYANQIGFAEGYLFAVIQRTAIDVDKLD